MSWLARSVANSLMSDHGVDDEDEDEEDDGEDGRAESKRSNHEEEELGGNDVIVNDEESADPNQGVKQDISQLTQTLTRQFWGVASFLAPPPPPHPISSSAHLHRRHSNQEEEASVADSPRIAGIRSDFAEIGGSLRSGISRLSNTAAVSEIGKIASNFLPYKPEDYQEQEKEQEQEQEKEYDDHHHDHQKQRQQKEEEDDGDDDDDDDYDEDEECAIGVTDEVMAFARNIALHPETWLDFPLFNDFEDTNDFEMSDAQLHHAFVVESLEPRFAALRIELCPAHMTEGCFWKIYFILLHSRLSKHDAELLSTPQIVEARAMLLQKLQEQTKPEPESCNRGLPYGNESISKDSLQGQTMEPSHIQSVTSSSSMFPIESKSVQEIKKHTGHPKVESMESIIEAKESTPPNLHNYDNDEDDEWFKEEESNDIGVSERTIVPFGNEEDVSFSDLEEEDEPKAPSSSKTLSSELKVSSSVVHSTKNFEL